MNTFNVEITNIAYAWREFYFPGTRFGCEVVRDHNGITTITMMWDGEPVTDHTGANMELRSNCPYEVLQIIAQIGNHHAFHQD